MRGTEPVAERVRAYDAKFLDDAHRDTPMNVGGFITFGRCEGGLALETLRTLVGERLALLPRLRQRIDDRSGDLVWVDDHRFDLTRHVDELPFARDDTDLPAHLARLHATALDAETPPWKISLMRQGDNGGAAIFFRASHVIVDGLSSMHVMRSLFDGPARVVDRPPPSSPLTGDSPDADSGEPPDAVDVVRDLWSTMRPSSEPLELESYEQALALLDGWLSMLDRGQHGMPRFAGSGPVATRIGLTELPSRDLRRVRLDRSVRFDELGLSIVGGALARRFAALGTAIEPDARIRTLVPIGGATPGHRSSLGNRSSYLLIALPIGEMSATDRLDLVRREVREALDAGQHRAAAMSLRALQSLPPESAHAISSFTTDRRFVDLVVSCIPGSRRALRLGGVPHEVTFPILPVTRAVRVAVGIGDIAGRLGVSVTADAASLPELDFVLDGMRRTAAALIAS